ncbi:hypothetical protein BHAOGJBA_1339 [Methylobacterium hispanicum]|uniref:Uncharacterized protein n=1 Tax=Methylobacterium hispanicum TaxID=270350 RepID=A0AAV4ZIA6_9HYPH|nr:hypothetical protein BHAOGJBA_1339 [Methylobacterium hispanicum]
MMSFPGPRPAGDRSGVWPCGKHAARGCMPAGIGFLAGEARLGIVRGQVA